MAKKTYSAIDAFEKKYGKSNEKVNRETEEREQKSKQEYVAQQKAKEEAYTQYKAEVKNAVQTALAGRNQQPGYAADTNNYNRFGEDGSGNSPLYQQANKNEQDKRIQYNETVNSALYQKKLDESNFIKGKQLEQNEARQNSVLYDKLMSIASADQYKTETGASKQKAEDDARAALDAAEKAYNKKYQQNVSRKNKVTGSTGNQNFDAELDLLRQDLENKKKAYDQASQDNYNYKTSALGFRNANLYDTTIGSVKRGLLNSRAGEAAYKTFIQNNPNYKDMFGNSYEDFNNELNGEEYKFTANNPVSSAVSGWAELVGQGIYQKANARAVLSAIAGAATAYKSSMMNPNVSPTQKRAQAAAGFMLGLNAASSVSNMEIEAGQAYLEMVDKGISDDTAKKMAAVVGGVNGILEFMQADEVAKAFFVLDSNPATKSLAKTIKQEAIDRGLDVLNETLQEVAQEGTTIAGVNLAGLKDLGRQVYTDYEVKDRLKDTAISSALSFGAGNIITGGINYATGGVNGAVYKYRNLQNLGKNSDIKTAEDVQTIIDAIDTDPEAYTVDGVVDENLMKKATDLKAYAEKVEQKLEAGGELTTNEKARLEQGQIDLVQSVSEVTGSQVEYNPEVVYTPNAEETSRNEENTVSVEEKLRSIANDVATEQVAKQEAEIERIMSEQNNEAPAAEVKRANNEVKNAETKMTQDTSVPYNVLSNKARISLEEQLYGKEEVNGKSSNREEWKISLGGYERLTESQQASYRQQIVRRKEIRNLQQTSYVERRSSDLTPIGTASTVRVANKEFVKNNKWAAKIVADNAAQGIRTTLVFDDIKVDEGDGEYDARAYISDDRKHIIVNVNNPAFTAEQLNDHERFHREVSIDPSIMKSVKAKLSNYTDKQLSDMAEAYEATYMFMDDVDKVLEEIFADVYADMFLPEGVFTNENIRDKVVSSVSEAKANKEVQRGPPVSDKIAKMSRSFRGDIEGQLSINFDTMTIEDKSIAVDALADLKALETYYGKVKTEENYVSLTKEFLEQGNVLYEGRTVKSGKDIALLCQVYRDPRYETFRAFFVDGNGKIVFQTGVTSSLPSCCASWAEKTDGLVYYSDLFIAAKNAGASGVYIEHNHPSGEATPSKEDIQTTKWLENFSNMNGIKFNGHIIIDHDYYSEIKPGGKWKSYYIENNKDTTESVLRTDGIYTGQKIMSAYDIAFIGKDIRGANENGGEDTSTIVNLGADNRVRSIQTASNDFVKKENDLLKHIDNMTTYFGAGRTVIETNDIQTYYSLARLANEKKITGAIYSGEGGYKSNIVNVENFEKDAQKRAKRVGNTKFSRSAPTSDTSGRELTQGQKEYFKDSKVIDENGNLKVMYHGTDNFGFNVFNQNKNNKGISKKYSAIFLTDNKEIANEYRSEEGGVYELYANVKNPYIVDVKGQSFHNWDVEKYDKVYTDVLLEPSDEGHIFAYWHTPESRTRHYGNFTESELVKKFGEKIGMFDFATDTNIGVIYLDENGENIPTSTDDAVLYAKNHGYDGVIFNNIRDAGYYAKDHSKESTVVAVFKNNDVKRTDNLNPKKSSNDIRYSRSIKYTDEEYMKVAESGDISAAQKMVDEAADKWGAFKGKDGKPLKLYHGTDNGEFYTFDIKRSGSNYDNWGRLGKGIYLTPSKSDAKIWAEKGKGQKNTRIIEAYIKMDNPLNIYDECPKDIKEYVHENFAKKYGWSEFAEKFVTNAGYRFIDYIQNEEKLDARNVLKELGYDGAYSDTEYVVYNPNQVKSAEAETHDKNGNIISLSERFNDTNEDIRYSRSSDFSPMSIGEQEAKNYETLLASSPALRAASNKLTHALKYTDHIVDTNQVKALAKELIDKNGSKIKVTELTNMISDLYQLIHDQYQIDGDEVTSVSMYIADAVLNNSKRVYDDNDIKRYKEFKNELKKHKINITPEIIAAFGDKQSFMDFRKKYFGTINFVKEGGRGIDEVYSGLRQFYSDILPEELNGENEMRNIEAALETLAPQPILVGEDYYNEQIDISSQIFNKYFDTAFIPKAEGKDVRAYIKEYNTAIEEYKKNLELEYQQAKRELQNEKAKYRQAIKDAEEDKFNFIQKENEHLNRVEIAMQESANRQIAEAKAIAKKIASQRIAEARAYNDKQSAKKTIMRDVNALSKMLTNPTDAKHVPETLRKPLAQFLSLIDFSSSRTLPDGTETKRTMAWMDMAKAMSDIEKNDGVYVAQDGSTQYYEIDPDIIATMDDLKDKIAGINKLDNLTMDELRDLRNTVQAMKKTIGDANRMIASERGASVSEVTEGSISELKSFKKYREFVGWIGTVKNLLSSKMLSADTRFHTFGKNAEEVYRPIREGFNVKVRHTQEAVEYFAKLKEEVGVTDKEINEWGNDKAEKITITTENGQTLSLKPAQAMSLYELWKRPQAQKHITDGGVITKDVVKTGVVKEKVQSEITPLTEKDIKKIADQLTDKQKALADGITRFFRRTAEWGNNASLKMFGYRKFNDGAYFPIKVDKNTLHTTSEGNVKGDTVSIKNAGFTKEVKKDAANPLILLDIVDVFTDQVNGMSNYDAFLAPMSDLLKWYNYKGQGYDTIKNALEHAYGSAATSYVHQFISDLNGFQNTDKYFANNMVGMFKGAAVGANLSVAIQQPTSYARALAVMEPKYLIAGLNAMKKAEIGDYENVLKYSGIAQWKDWGFYETDIGKSMRTIVTSTGELKAVTNKEEFKQWLNNAQMTLAEKGDKITWAALWKASEAKVKDTTDLTPGTDEFYKATAKVFDNIIDRTQVVDSLFSRAEIMRSKNDLTKMAVSFMNEPMKSYNSLAWASFDLATAKDKQTKQKAAKSFAAAGVAFILSNILAAAAKSLVTALRNKDKDKKYLERYWEAFTGEAFGNLMPWNYIPYIKDIYSIFQGYDVERTDMTGIVELYDAFNRWKKFFEGESKYSLGSNMLYSLKALSNLTGIAYYGFYRDFDALLTESLHALDAQEALYEKEKLTGEKLAVGNTYAKMALKAYASGNPTLGNKIVNELITVDENGKLDDKLKDMMKKDTALAKLVYSNTGKEDVHYTAAEAIFSAAKNGETKKKESVDILLKLDISKEDKEYLYEKHYTTKELTEWKQNGGSTYDFMTSGSEMNDKVSEEKAAGSAGDSAVANAALDMIQSGTSKDVVSDLYYQKTKDNGFKEYTDNGGSAEKYIKGEKEYYGLVEKAQEDDGKLSDPELYDIALQMLNSGTDEDVVKYLYNKQKEHNPIDDWEGSTKEYFEDAKEISEHKQTITNGGRSTNATKKQIADKIKTMVSDEDAQKVLWELAGYSVDSTKDGQVIEDGNYNKYFK